MVAYRHWCNKLWNAVRFAMLNLGEGFAPPPGHAPGSAPAPDQAPLACRWVLSRLSAATEAVVGGFTSYEFAAATNVRMQLLKDDCSVMLSILRLHVWVGGAWRGWTYVW